MSIRTINVKVTGCRVSTSSDVAGAVGGYKPALLVFDFNDEWYDAAISLYFTDARGRNPVIKLLGPADINSEGFYQYEIPAEPLQQAGQMSLTIRGVIAEGEVTERILTTRDIKLRVLPNNYSSEAVEAALPAQELIVQLQGADQYNNSKLTNHVAGEADKHNAEHVLYQGDLHGVTNTKEALDKLTQYATSTASYVEEDLINKLTNPDEFPLSEGEAIPPIIPLMEVGGYDRVTGEKNVRDLYTRTADFVQIELGVPYIYENTGNYAMCLLFYRADYSFISGWNGGYNYRWLDSGLEFSAPVEAKYVRFYTDRSNDMSVVYSIIDPRGTSEKANFKEQYFGSYRMAANEIDPGLYELALQQLKDEFSIFTIRGPANNPSEATLALVLWDGTTKQICDISCMRYDKNERGNVCFVVQKRGDTPMPYFFVGFNDGVGPARVQKLRIEPDAIPMIMTSTGLRVRRDNTYDNLWTAENMVDINLITMKEDIDTLKSSGSTGYSNVYTQSRIDERKSTIYNLQRAGNTITFVTPTDLHLHVPSESMTRYDRLKDLHMITKQIPIDFVAVTGDFTNSTYNFNGFDPRLEEAANILNGCRSPWYAVRGNHDTNRYDNGYATNPYITDLTSQNALDLLLRNDDWYQSIDSQYRNTQRFTVVYDAERPKAGYYYVDDNIKKVRLVFCNSDELIELSSGLPFLANHYSNSYIDGAVGSKNQLEWLLTKALDMTGKTGWSVAFFSHKVPYTDAGTGDTSEFHGYGTNVPHLRTLIKAFQEGTQLTNFSYPCYDMQQLGTVTYTINRNFATQGAIKVIGWFGGHVHDDCYRKVDGLNVCVSTNTHPSQRTSWDLDLTPTKLPPIRNDTSRAMSLNVWIVNLETRTVNMIKVGSKRSDSVVTSSDITFTY